MLRGVLTDTQQSTDRARVVSLGSPSEGAEPVLANRSFDLTPGTGGWAPSRTVVLASDHATTIAAAKIMARSGSAFALAPIDKIRNSP